MKKIHEIVKPFLSIILGALLFLIYLNNLASEGSGLAIGIVGLVIASFYLAAGILGLLLGDKLPEMPRKILAMLSISLYPLLMFVLYLLIVIDAHELLGPTGWTIMIITLSGSLFLAVIYPLSKFIRNRLINLLVLLASAVFVLVLLLGILFDFNGALTGIGDISLGLLVIDLVFGLMLFEAIQENVTEAKQAPVKEEAPREEKVEEKPQEAPQEEKAE